jgi:heme oxygenase (mycobilin-producing)
MSAARIGEFRASPGQNEALRDFLGSILPLILSSQGCLSCDLFQSKEDPAEFIIVEVWESIEAHQASVKNIPPEMMGEILPLLAGSPGGHYYDALAHERSKHGL